MTRALISMVMLLSAVTVASPALARGGSQPTEPTLEARALLAPDASTPAPFPGVPSGEPEPQSGARQPVGGFSALIDAPGRDWYWAMPDNGFGSKANVPAPALRRADRLGDGSRRQRVVEVRDWITLSDPRHRVPFESSTRARAIGC